MGKKPEHQQQQICCVNFALSFVFRCKQKGAAIFDFSLSSPEARMRRHFVHCRGTTGPHDLIFFNRKHSSKHCQYVRPLLIRLFVRLSAIRTLFHVILRHRDVYSLHFTSFVMIVASFHIILFIASPHCTFLF